MKFVMMDPRLIEPSPWNTNVVSHENEEKIKASLARHGMFKPLLVRDLPGGVIQSVGGWHRCEQAIELGYAEVPVFNLGTISDDKAKEISLIDNARYGVDDTMRLSELLRDLDAQAIESTTPWTLRDISSITQSLSVDVDDLDLDEPVLPTDDDEDDEPVVPKAPKTHTIMRFRCSNEDAAKIALRVQDAMKTQGFTKEDDLTNAGDALAYLLLKDDGDAE